MSETRQLENAYVIDVGYRKEQPIAFVKIAFSSALVPSSVIATSVKYVKTSLLIATPFKVSAEDTGTTLAQDEKMPEEAKTAIINTKEIFLFKLLKTVFFILLRTFQKYSCVAYTVFVVSVVLLSSSKFA